MDEKNILKSLNKVYSDRSELHFSDETIRVQNCNFNCWVAYNIYIFLNL